jgi:hypothetical protein
MLPLSVTLDIRFLDDHRTAQTIESMQSIMDSQGEADRTPDNSFLEEAKTGVLRSLTLIIPITSYEMQWDGRRQRCIVF